MKNRKAAAAICLLLVTLTAAVFLFSHTDEKALMAYPAFMNAMERGEVKQVVLSQSEDLKVTLTDGSERLVPNPRYENFKSELLMQGVAVEEAKAGGADLLLALLMLSVLAAAFYRGRGQGAMARYARMEEARQIPSCGFGQVAGNREALESLQDLVDFLKAPEQFKAYGAKPPRGVMLYGPPGTGKTLLARALAGEAGVPFYAVNGSDFVQVYVGVGASRIRTLFAKARKAGRAVIFIDEIDAIGKKRDNGNDEREQTLNALLTEMSGFDQGEGVIVLAATNRLDTLDGALLRAGRFDRHIEVPLPDVKERLAILKAHGADKPLDEDADLDRIARQTVFFSGAQLETLMNEAAILAARRSEGKIAAGDLDQAVIQMLAGRERRDAQLHEKDREIIAAHEAGHALATLRLLPENSIHRVSIIPSVKGAGGYVMTLPKDRSLHARRELEAQLTVLLAGRAAEERAFGREGVTTGAAGDLEKAFKIAGQMAALWGMAPSGQLLAKEQEKEEAAALLIRQAYERALGLLEEGHEAWMRIRKELLAKETLTGHEIHTLV